MKLYIDDANPEEIRRLWTLYPADGVTTNPYILSREGSDPRSTLNQIRQIIGSEAELFVQVLADEADEIVLEAETIAGALGGRTVVKIPSVPAGFQAMKALKAKGIVTCGTAVYTPMQAYLAAKSGAAYVAPYLNRIDNMGFDGVRIVKQIQDILTRGKYGAEVLAASFKNSQQVLELCEYGIGAATCAPAILDGFVKNAAIDAAVAAFTADFEKAVGKGKTMKSILG